MDKEQLEKLKRHIDAAIYTDTPDAIAGLEQQLEITLRQIRSSRQPSPPPSADMSSVLNILNDLWFSAAPPPETLPGDAQQQADLAQLLSAMLTTQRFALALSQGDLSQTLEGRGTMAGSLKSLQASLRHLTWQADQLAKGDFNQRVDFMGEFSQSFNSMVVSLAQALSQIREQNQALAQINLSLQEEISTRKKIEEEQRLATARAEIHRRLIEQREQDRLQIARDLHDGPVQDLIALSITLSSLLSTIQGTEPRQALQEAYETVRRLIVEMRELAGDLRPPALSQFGLKTTIQSHANKFMQKYPHLEIDMNLASEDTRLPERIQLALFRIYQEALNNIVKHAQASVVRVKLQTSGANVQLCIEDDGQGFEPPKDWLDFARHGHLGLVGIRERVEAIGGLAELRSQPGQGTKINISIPHG